jgi:DNA-binding CsgD family transcriptional regulator
MLKTIREYGLERLATSGETEAIQQAHASYYLALAEEADRGIWSPQQFVWLERLEREHGNLRAAMHWLLEQQENEQRREMALRLGGALLRFWEVHGHWSEAWNFLEWVRTTSKGVAASAQVKALMAAAYLLDHFENDIDRAQAFYEESLALQRELGDTTGVAFSLLNVGDIAGRTGNFAVASAQIEEAIALFRSVGDERGIAWAITNLADIVSRQGEYARAISLNEESLARLRVVGDSEDIAWALYYLAGIISQQGQYSRAISLVEESQVRFRALGDMEGSIWSLFGLARVLFLSQGDPAKVYALLDEGLGLSKQVGHKLGIAWALSHQSELFLLQGEALRARSPLVESLPLYREARDQQSLTESLSILGRVETLAGDYTAARTAYEESLAIGRAIGDNLSISFSLEGLAVVIAVQGDPVSAARLWGCAETMREAMGTPIPPVYRAAYERSVAAARAQLGERAFAAAWDEGRTMTPEQALAAARQPIRPAPTSPARSTATYTDGLTVREVEVLRLLAQGLTSAQIAKHLVISVVTVNFHVRSIYSKLGVTSRAAATRYAVEHNLV